MQVVTLNAEELEAHAARLAWEVEESSSIRYDAIVAVRRGGSYVCDAFCRHFPKDRYGGRYDVSLQRPSTKLKERRTGKTLKRLPYPLLDAMRKIESEILALLRRIKGPAAAPQVEMPEGLVATLTLNALPKILLIDDAIDSGDTLRAITETLKKTNPDTETDIAVVTETTNRPCIRANYTLYRNRTLIRFPWASDYKNH